MLQRLLIAYDRRLPEDSSRNALPLSHMSTFLQLRPRRMTGIEIQLNRLSLVREHDVQGTEVRESQAMEVIQSRLDGGNTLAALIQPEG